MKGYLCLSVILAVAVLLCSGCSDQQQAESGEMLQEEEKFLADWTEHLPEWESQLGTFDGKLKLKEEEWLAIKAEHYYDMGASGTFLIRDKGEVRFLQDKIVPDTGIISISEPQVMRGWNAEWQSIWGGETEAQGYFYGVYRISDEKWILEPVYDYIDNSNPDFHYSIRTGISDNTKELYSFYDSKWNLLWSKELGDSDVYEVEDYIWIMDLTGVWDGVRSLTTSIYDRKGELVCTLDTPSLIKSPNGSYNSWFGEGNMMCIRSEQDGSWYLYQSDGNLLFDNSQIPDSIREQIYREGADTEETGIKVAMCLLDGRLAVLEYGGRKRLYDIETQELLSSPEDTLEWDNGKMRMPQAVAVISPDGERTIYRYDKTSPVTSQGLPYLYLIGGAGEDETQYYYRIDDNVVTLGDGENMEYTYQDNFYETTQIEPYKGKIILLRDRENPDADTYVYLGKELVMSGTELERNYDNVVYSIKNKATGEKLLMDKEGNFGQCKKNQSVLKMGTDFTVTMEKETLFSVVDGEGRPVVRVPKQYKFPIAGVSESY